MIINISNLKKKIIYRSNYRGTKEMDKLLSSFTQRYINELNDSELSDLCELLDLDDESLYNFNQDKKISKLIKTNKVTDLFKKFEYKSK
ncbi:succinate dehydrogenase assembly factor 2 [Candidatus Pelagibacter sp.]|nr:succinate dehydrogenase assembly factor 2 [Candidatus Pelagibacter sp.]